MSRRRIAGVRKSAEKVHRYYYRNRGNQSGPGSAAQAGQMIGCRDYGKGTFTPLVVRLRETYEIVCCF